MIQKRKTPPANNPGNAKKQNRGFQPVPPAAPPAAPPQGQPFVPQPSRFDEVTQPIPIDFQSDKYVLFVYGQDLCFQSDPQNINNMALNLSQQNLSIQIPNNADDNLQDDQFFNINNPINNPIPNNGTPYLIGSLALQQLLPEIQDSGGGGTLRGLPGAITLVQVRKNGFIVCFKGLNYLRQINSIALGNPMINPFNRVSDIFSVFPWAFSFLTPQFKSRLLGSNDVVLQFNFKLLISVLDTKGLDEEKISRAELDEKYTFSADSAIIQILSIFNALKNYYENNNSPVSQENRVASLNAINNALEAFVLTSSLKENLDVAQLCPIANQTIYLNQQYWSKNQIFNRIFIINPVWQVGQNTALQSIDDLEYPIRDLLNQQQLDLYGGINSLPKAAVEESYDNVAVKIIGYKGGLSYTSASIKHINISAGGSIPFLIDQRNIYLLCFLYLHPDNFIPAEMINGEEIINPAQAQANIPLPNFLLQAPQNVVLWQKLCYLLFLFIQLINIYKNQPQQFIMPLPYLLTDVIYCLLSSDLFISYLQYLSIYNGNPILDDIPTEIYYIISNTNFLLNSNNYYYGNPRGLDKNMNFALQLLKDNLDSAGHDNKSTKTFRLVMYFNIIYKFAGTNRDLYEMVEEMFPQQIQPPNAIERDELPQATNTFISTPPPNQNFRPLDPNFLNNQTHQNQHTNVFQNYPFDQLYKTYESNILGYLNFLIVNFHSYAQKIFYFLALKDFKEIEERGLFNRLSTKCCYVFQKRSLKFDLYTPNSIQPKNNMIIVSGNNINSVHAAYQGVQLQDLNIALGNVNPIGPLRLTNFIDQGVIIPQSRFGVIDLSIPDGQSLSDIDNLFSLTNRMSPSIRSLLGDSPIGLNDAASRAKNIYERQFAFPTFCLPLPFGPIPGRPDPLNSPQLTNGQHPITYRMGYVFVAQYHRPIHVINILNPLTNPNVSQFILDDINNYLNMVQNSNIYFKEDAISMGAAYCVAFITLYRNFNANLNVNTNLIPIVYNVFNQRLRTNVNFFNYQNPNPNQANFLNLFEPLYRSFFRFLENTRRRASSATITSINYKGLLNDLIDGNGTPWPDGGLRSFFSSNIMVPNNDTALYYYLIMRYILCPLYPSVNDKDRIHCDVQRLNSNDGSDIFDALLKGFDNIASLNADVSANLRQSARKMRGGRADISSSLSLSATKPSLVNNDSVLSSPSSFKPSSISTEKSNSNTLLQTVTKPKTKSNGSLKNTYLFGKYGFYFGVNSEGGFEIIPLNTQEELNNYQKKFFPSEALNPISNQNNNSQTLANQSKGGKIKKNYTLKRYNKKVSKKNIFHKNKNNKSKKCKKTIRKI